jgi:hypothetical protein
MMILPLVLVMVLPKMMNDPETRKVREQVFLSDIQICMDSGVKSMLHSVLSSVPNATVSQITML